MKLVAGSVPALPVRLQALAASPARSAKGADRSRTLGSALDAIVVSSQMLSVINVAELIDCSSTVNTPALTATVIVLESHSWFPAFCASKSLKHIE